jgi:hypothetical protein
MSASKCPFCGEMTLLPSSSKIEESITKFYYTCANCGQTWPQKDLTQKYRCKRCGSIVDSSKGYPPAQSRGEPVQKPKMAFTFGLRPRPRIDVDCHQKTFLRLWQRVSPLLPDWPSNHFCILNHQHGTPHLCWRGAWGSNYSFRQPSPDFRQVRAVPSQRLDSMPQL